MANNTFVNVGGYKVSVGKKYSTSEVKTGDVWIDGKPIYRKVYTQKSINVSGGAGRYYVDYSDQKPINVDTFIGGRLIWNATNTSNVTTEDFKETLTMYETTISWSVFLQSISNIQCNSTALPVWGNKTLTIKFVVVYYTKTSN